ncbi:MAG: ATP-binding cassette domain-containing protein [Candidatus Andersenbacteria bacterium]
MSVSFIEVKNVDVSYPGRASSIQKLLGKSTAGHSALRAVDMKIEQGDHVTLFGPAGSGKTTLLRLLTGTITPDKGLVKVNGISPGSRDSLAAGYISSEESEPAKDTVNEVLYAFGQTHGLSNLPARIGVLVETLEIDHILHRPVAGLSTTERLLINIARAALSDTPLVLLDGVAEELGVENVQHALHQLFSGRTVIVATRFPDIAERLELPILLMHRGTLAHTGTCNDIANAVGCRRTVDVWIEGLRYDLLRNMRRHAGVDEVRLLPTDQFDGQRLRVTLKSSRYLPALYDMVSQAPLVRIEELPASLTDILARL